MIVRARYFRILISSGKILCFDYINEGWRAEMAAAKAARPQNCVRLAD
jgi:hypothetical protein